MKHDVLVENLLTHLDESERPRLLVLCEQFSIPLDLVVYPFDDSSKISDFYEYLDKYPSLKKDLLDNLCSSDCFHWLQRVSETKKAYFLVCNSRWKGTHRNMKEKVSLRFVLIGLKSKYPTIEINID